MLFGYISNIKQEMPLYPAALQTGLNFLREADLASLALGRHEIEQDRIYASIAEYETEPKDQRRPEAHKKYIDIQYVCSGAEMIGVAPLEQAREVAEDCLTERDVIFYRHIPGETDLTLLPGMFAIFFPWDVHRPNCSLGGENGRVRKVVVKIAVDAI